MEKQKSNRDANNRRDADTSDAPRLVKDGHRDDFLRKIIENPDLLDSLDDENLDELVESSKRGNPYGIIPSETDGYVNISVTNLREKYLKRLIMTSAVSFLFKSLDEWTYEFTDEEYDELRAMSGQQMRDVYKKQKQDEFNKTYKEPVLAFLRRKFEYNPDVHVRTSHTENPGDPSRPSKTDALKSAMDNSQYKEPVAKLLNTESSQKDIVEKYLDLYNRYDELYKSAKDVRQVVDVIKTIDDSSEVVKSIDRHLATTELSVYDKLHSMKPVMKVLQSDASLYALKTNLPENVFHDWENYHELNYEALRDVVNILYSYKPDLEYAILPYDKFDTEDEARVHRYKYEKDLITSVYTVKCGQWSFLGPFKQNKDRLDFYNKETAVIFDIINTQKKEGDIAKEILKKKVKSGKLQNVKESGPDDKGLKEYSTTIADINAANTKLKEYNIKPQLTTEEREEMSELIKKRDMLIDRSRELEMENVPEDAVQVDFFRTDKDGNFKRNILYTESDTPDDIKRLLEESSENMVKNMQKK